MLGAAVDGLKSVFAPFMTEFLEAGVYLHGLVVAEPEATWGLVTLLHRKYADIVLNDPEQKKLQERLGLMIEPLKLTGQFSMEES